MFLNGLGEYENLSIGMRVKIVRRPYDSPLTVYAMGTITGQGYYNKLWQAKGDDGLTYEVSNIIGFIPDVPPVQPTYSITTPIAPVSTSFAIDTTPQILGLPWYIFIGGGAAGLLILKKFLRPKTQQGGA